MPSNHESILHVVDKVLHEIVDGQHKVTIIDRWVFRTRDAARNFRKTRRASKKFEYHVGSAKWGPDN